MNPETRRHLSKGMRAANFFYKLLLGFLSATNFTLIMLDSNVEKIHINETYFEVMSVVIAIVPIFWSQLLDSCKSINVNVPSLPVSPAIGNSLPTTSEQK